MRRLSLAVALTAALMGCGAAAAVLTPGRTVSNPSTIAALGVTYTSVVYAVREVGDRKQCAYVVLWNTATKGLWRLGESTTRVCTEGPSTGSGVSQVATSGRRVFWVTYAGGNFREETLWTATPGRPSPRRLADATSEVDSGARPIVLAPGTREGVAYATGRVVTFVGDDGARRFRVTLSADVRLLSTGVGPGAGRVVASLADGSVVTLSTAGDVVRTDAYPSGAVSALRLALAGPIVQVGATIHVGARTVPLPAGATMLDFRQGRIVYATGSRVMARRVSTGDDVLLRVIPVKPWERPLFSTDAWGSAWATGKTVAWRSGPLA